MRQLKDLKAAISEKTVPKSIKILQRTVYLLILIIIVLTAVSLGEKIKQTSDIEEGMTGIYTSYNRHNVMSNINYNTRKMWLADNQYTPATPDVYFYPYRYNLTKFIDLLQSVQFQVIKSQIKMEDRKSHGLDSKQYTVQFLLTDNSIKSYENTFSDAMF